MNHQTGKEVNLIVEAVKKDTYLTEKETAAITKEALATLRNNRSLRRGLPYLKVGRRSVRYRLSDVISYLERRRIVPEGTGDH